VLVAIETGTIRENFPRFAKLQAQQLWQSTLDRE